MHDGSAKKSLGSHTDEFHSLCYTYFNYETQACCWLPTACGESEEAQQQFGNN